MFSGVFFWFCWVNDLPMHLSILLFSLALLSLVAFHKPVGPSRRSVRVGDPCEERSELSIDIALDKAGSRRNRLLRFLKRFPVVL